MSNGCNPYRIAHKAEHPGNSSILYHHRAALKSTRFIFEIIRVPNFYLVRVLKIDLS